MTIRDFVPEDRTDYLAMSNAFYHSGAVSHAVPGEHHARTFDLCLQGSPFVRGLLLEEAEAIAGFALLSFTYSNEAGGMVVWLEELYIIPQMQGKGLGTAFFRWMMAQYPQAARFRLEVEPENLAAAALYRRLGFKDLPYSQMVQEKAPD